VAGGDYSERMPNDTGESEGHGRDLRDLVDPVVVVAFGGWNDAGNAATGVVDHLGEAYGAELAFALDPDDFYDYQVNRPTVSLTDDDERVLTWPTTEIRVGRLASGRDLLLVQGLEPNLRWRQFTTTVASALQSANARRVHVLGALLADTPHTRPIPVSTSTYDRDLMTTLGLAPSTYEGPTGIVGVLQASVAERGIPCASLWASVPHYVAAAPNPKAALALLRRLEGLVGVAVDGSELETAAADYERQVGLAVQSDPDVQAFVERLEQLAEDERGDQPQDIPSGDRLAREFQRFLRQRGGDADDE
jgi:predicted ATP-grasp superfamily ATP-dependent carboligase